MNKKIKVIELLNKIANGEEIPKNIKVKDKEYYIDGSIYYTVGEDDEDLFNLMSYMNTLDFLKLEVEILEDNTEEIEEIKGWGLATDYKDFETINHTLDRFGNKINELVKEIRQIRKEKNNDK